MYDSLGTTQTSLPTQGGGPHTRWWAPCQWWALHELGSTRGGGPFYINEVLTESLRSSALLPTIPCVRPSCL